MSESQSEKKIQVTSSASTEAVAKTVQGSVSGPVKSNRVSELRAQLGKALFKLMKSETAASEAEIQATQATVQEVIEELKLENSVFLGTMAKCWIQGHDVHILFVEGGELTHFKPSQSLPEGFEKARGLIATLGNQSCGIMVYSDKMEYLNWDGSCQEILQ